MEDDEITHWLELPAGMGFVPFSELAHRIAKALFPVAPEDEEYDPYYGAARLNLDEELPKAVATKLLKVLDSLTHGPLTFPHGFALQSAVVKVSDLRAYLAERGMGVRFASAPVGEPVPTAAVPSIAPVGKATTPPPLTTPEIADAFDGIDGLTAKKWRNKLGDVNNHQWVLPARDEKARAPAKATWWPVVFAELLLARGASDESLNRAFLAEPKLKPWLPLWQEKRRERNAFGQ